MKSPTLALLSEGWVRRFIRKSSAIMFVSLGFLWLAPVSSISAQTNVAQGKPTSQSSTTWGGNASRGVDGNTNGNYFTAYSVTHTNNGANEHWQVDLQDAYSISQISIANRTDCCAERLVGATVQIHSGNQMVWSGAITSIAANPIVFDIPGVLGNMVRVLNRRHEYLSLAEVEVIGTSSLLPRFRSWRLIQ